MRILNAFRAALAAACLLAAGLTAAPALAADNYTVTQGTGKTMRCKDISTVCYITHTVADSTGAIIDPATSGLQTSANTKLDTLHADVLTLQGYEDGIEALLGTGNTSLGAPGATVCATDNGSCSLNALIQRLNSRVTSLITALGSPAQANGAVYLKDSGGADATDTTNHAIKTVCVSGCGAGGGGGASEVHLGEVGGKTIIASANFTTPAGTTAYAASDLVANSATAGSVAPLTFTVCRINGGTGMIRRARFKTTDSGFAGKSVSLKLYRDAPTVANGDNGVWLSSESNYLGSITVSVDQTFSDPIYKGVGSPDVGGEINFDCASGVQTISGLEVVNGAATPVGAKVHTWVLEVLAN